MRRAASLASLFLVLSLACADDGAREDSSAGSGFEGDTSTPTSTGDTTAGTSDTTTNDTTTADTTMDSSSDSGGESASYCVHQCDSAADCTVMAMDLGYACEDHSCVSASSSCTDDAECVAYLSGWTQGTPCTAGGGECDAAMQVCLEIEGSGRCAIAPSDFITCEGVGLDEIPMTDIEGSAALVCGQADAACHPDAYCHLPCQDNLDCASAAYPECDGGTGLCECTADADCQTLGLAQFSVCNAGVCGCSSDADCAGAGVGDVCTAQGACGCTGDAACAGVANSFDGGMIQCVEY